MTKIQTAVVGGLLVAVSLLCGYGVSRMFPGGEAVFYDRQLSLQPPGPIDPSIVMIPVDEDSVLSCGEGRWNALFLAQAISALHHAGARVIAPAGPVHMPNPHECGDAFGSAQLLEVVKRAGNVVFPSFVPPVLAEHAVATGTYELRGDADGVFRRLPSQQTTDHVGLRSFGAAVASVASPETKIALPEKGLVPFAGRWADGAFFTHPYDQVAGLIHRQDVQTLSILVRDNIVLLFPVGHSGHTRATPLESAVPLGYLHATIVNAALTRSWPQTAPWTVWAVQTTGVAAIVVWFVLWRRDVWGWVAAAAVIVAYVVMEGVIRATHVVTEHSLASLVSLAMAMSGALAFHWYDRGQRIRRQIRAVGRHIAETREIAARNETAVARLEDELLAAQAAAEQTAERYDALSAQEDDARRRLEAAEAEAFTTQRQLDALEGELASLRKRAVVDAVPASDTSMEDDSQEELRAECEAYGILTRSPNVLAAFQKVKKAAATDHPILILGETGTGKEVFAKAVHQLSARAARACVSVNMAAVRPELFESEVFGHVKGAFTGAISRRGWLETADGGTLFLDEIGELPVEMQAKLLRVLEDGTFYRVGQSTPSHVDVRIIAATNRDLVQAIHEGHYREDLYYRLRSVEVRLPPLRERGRDDLALLTERMLRELSDGQPNGPCRVTERVMDLMAQYAWPGNIRELRQTLSQAVMLAETGVITDDMLRLPGTPVSSVTLDSETSPEGAGGDGGGKAERARREDTLVLATLQQCGFDMKAAAKALQWDRSTVTQRLKGLGFQALSTHGGDTHAAAQVLVRHAAQVPVVELKLVEYYRNLLSAAKACPTVDDALQDARKRLRNMPERYFPAIEALIRQAFDALETSRHDHDAD